MVCGRSSQVRNSPWQRRMRQMQQQFGSTGFGNIIAVAISTGADASSMLLGPILVCVAVGLIGYLVWLSFAIVAPMQMETFSLQWWMTFCVGMWILCNLTFHYFMCVITDPGSPPARLSPWLQGKLQTDVLRHRDVAVGGFFSQTALQHQSSPQARSLGAPSSTPGYPPVQQALQVQVPLAGTGRASAPQPNCVRPPEAMGPVQKEAALVQAMDAAVAGSQGGSTSSASTAAPTAAVSSTRSTAAAPRAGPDPNAPFGWCAVCQQVKPPRAHHCMVTNRCVLRMDHFCPWTNQTIGFLNYKHFFMFLVCMSMGALFIALFSLRPFLRVNFEEDRAVRRRIPGRSGIMLMFCLACAVGLAVTGMAVWHGFLIGTNCTTIEFYQNSSRRRQALLRGGQYKNPYDLGSLDANWEQVLGHPLTSLRWLLPSWQPPHGNGMEWRTRALGTTSGFQEPDETPGLVPAMQGWGTFFSEEGDSGDDDDDDGRVSGGAAVHYDDPADLEGGKGGRGAGRGSQSKGGAGLVDKEGAPRGLGQWLGGVPLAAAVPVPVPVGAGQDGGGPAGGTGQPLPRPPSPPLPAAESKSAGEDAPEMQAARGGLHNGAGMHRSGAGLASRPIAKVLDRSRGQMIL